MPAPLGAVVALVAEARCLGAHGVRTGEIFRIDETLWLQVSGVGAERATRAGEALLGAGARALLSFGVAAGITPGLETGTLLLPHELIAGDGRRLPTDRRWRERWGACAGTLNVRHEALAEAPLVLRDVAAKRALAKHTGAIAADMESAAVLALAASAGVPALVVRCVLDPLQQVLPTAALAGIRDDGTTDVPALLRALLRHPRELPALLALAGANRRALAVLSGFVRDVRRAAPAIDTDDAAREGGQNPRAVLRSQPGE